jgi:subtilisin family serine protease
MPRRIMLIRKSDWLQRAWQSRSFGPGGGELERQVKVPGVALDDTYHPVFVLWRRVPPAERPAAHGFDYARRGLIDTYAVRASFDDEDAVHRLRHDRGADIVGVFADPVVSVFPSSYCGGAAVGTAADVARRLGVPTLRALGLTGKDVHVAVVDTGIDGRRIPVAGGWTPVPGYVPGTARPDHGTMVAYDIRIAAPDAELYDYALLRSQGGPWGALLSDAIAAFADLIEKVNATPGRWVINNSWGMFDRTEDAPIGAPENYSANPDHPFNQITGSLVAAGADVFFAAGNCGAPCPDGRCGTADTGPGQSIHGANSHPDVVTVAAVTVTDRRLGYSSQGPGGLHARKPDIAAFSHFKGSGVWPVDGGTSAASPVAAGVAAALRQRFSASVLTPAQLKGALERSARDLDHRGWDYDLGYGAIDAAAATRALGLDAPSRATKRTKRIKPRRIRKRRLVGAGR